MKNKRCDCGAEIQKESKTCYKCGADLSFMGRMKFIIATSIFVMISTWWLYQKK